MPEVLPDNVRKERYIRDERYFTVYDQFTPKYDKKCLTPKFYSKYEGSLPDPNPALLEQVIEQNKSPREKLMWPETSNQWYGWFITPFVENKLHFPRKSTDMVKHLLLIRREKNIRGS